MEDKTELHVLYTCTVKPDLRGHLKRPKLIFKTVYRLCRSKVLQNAPREHSAIRLTFIKLPFVFITFVLSIFNGRLNVRQVLLYVISPNTF